MSSSEMPNELAMYLDAPSLPTSPHARGYRRLADFMEWTSSAAILPRFRAANMLNLLGLQAEICQLQEELENLANADDQQTDGPRKFYSTNWSILQKGEEGQSKQRQKILDLRSKLNEYTPNPDTALLQQVALNQQPSPHAGDLNYLQQWLNHREGGNAELRGPGSEVWFTMLGDKFNLDDKLTLASGLGSQDSLTRWIHQRLGKYVRTLSFLPIEVTPHPILGKNATLLLADIPKRRTFPSRSDRSGQDSFSIYSSSEKIVSAGDKIATILASLLTTIPIIILKFVHSTDLRLALVVIFTSLFSSMLAFLSNARRAEIFGASAAFAAVQVVFVGSVSPGA